MSEIPEPLLVETAKQHCTGMQEGSAETEEGEVLRYSLSKMGSIVCAPMAHGYVWLLWT